MTLVPAAVILAVALFGTLLGVVTARALKPYPIEAGVNLFGSGVQSGQALSPEDWASCIEHEGFKSIYTWDAPNQRWLHYFDPRHDDHDGLPEYVNEIGGIVEIRSSTGVYVIATADIPDAVFPSTQTEANNACGNPT